MDDMLYHLFDIIKLFVIMIGKKISLFLSENIGSIIRTY